MIKIITKNFLFGLFQAIFKPKKSLYICKVIFYEGRIMPIKTPPLNDVIPKVRHTSAPIMSNSAPRVNPNTAGDCYGGSKAAQQPAKTATLAGMTAGIFAGISAKIKSCQAKKALQKIDQKFDALQEKLPMVRYAFKTIFMRDNLSEKETSEMLDRYREIEKLRITGTDDEYITALYNEAKKNYGLGDADIPLHIEDVVGGNERIGGCAKELMNLGVYIKRQHGKSVMNEVHHELRHMKQNYIAANYDKDAYMRATLKSVYNKAKKDKTNFMHNIVKDKDFETFYNSVPEMIDCDIEAMEKVVGKFDRAKVREEDIPFAKKCLKAKETTADGISDYKNYRSNFLEEDAYWAGDMMKKLMDVG